MTDQSALIKRILERLGHEELELKKLGMVNHANGVRSAIVQILKLTDESQLAPQLAYGIIDPDYARVFTQARIVAWSYGYACVMHGSFTRDLDLLLVPWEERARPNGEQLMKLIAQGCGLRFRDGKEDINKATVDFSDKPHGRKACSLFFPQFGDRRWVDISIMSCASQPASLQAQGDPA